MRAVRAIYGVVLCTGGSFDAATPRRVLAHQGTGAEPEEAHNK